MARMAILLLAIFAVAQYQTVKGLPRRSHRERNLCKLHAIITEDHTSRDLSYFKPSWIPAFPSFPTFGQFFNDDKETVLVKKKLALLESAHKLLAERFDKIVETFKEFVNKYHGTDFFNINKKPEKEEVVTVKPESSTPNDEKPEGVTEINSEPESVVKPVPPEKDDDIIKPVPTTVTENDKKEDTTVSSTTISDEETTSSKPNDLIETSITENDELGKPEVSDESEKIQTIPSFEAESTTETTTEILQDDPSIVFGSIVSFDTKSAEHSFFDTNNEESVENSDNI